MKRFEVIVTNTIIHNDVKNNHKLMYTAHVRVH